MNFTKYFRKITLRNSCKLAKVFRLHNISYNCGEDLKTSNLLPSLAFVRGVCDFLPARCDHGTNAGTSIGFEVW